MWVVVVDWAEGRLSIEDALNLIKTASAETNVVGLGITEHIPWDMINLNHMLNEIPILGD